VRIPRGTVLALHRFAVKGLWFDDLPSVDLAPGETFPDDRAWALIRGDKVGEFKSEDPAWSHKSNFHCAFSAGEALSTLRTSYSAATKELRITDVNGTPLAVGCLSEVAGREGVEQFFRERLGDPELRVVSASSPADHQFNNTNCGKKVIHLINVQTVGALSEAIQCPLNVLRFRANIIFNGLPAWTEFEWVGKRIAIGGAELRVLRRTVRCAAITVDPETATMDMDLPAIIGQQFPEHGSYLGIYAEVVRAGRVQPGDPIVFLGS
jgi:uncharacterized protein YcbX